MAAMARWQVQEAKQRFSEVLRKALGEGPQIVTRHGEEIAVVIDIEEYHRLKRHGGGDPLMEFLLASPRLGDLDEMERPVEPMRDVDLGD
jgi:prevent-host-death family protein